MMGSDSNGTRFSREHGMDDVPFDNFLNVGGLLV